MKALQQGKKRELLPHDFIKPFLGLHFFLSFSIITGDNPFCACGANSQFGDFPLRENKEGGWRRRCWWWECGRGCFHPPPPLPPPPMRWALSSFLPTSPPAGRIWLQRNPVTSRDCCRGDDGDEKGAAPPDTTWPPYKLHWLARAAAVQSGARTIEVQSARLMPHKKPTVANG